MGDVVVLLALLAGVFLILRSQIRKFRRGECSGGCPGCSGCQGGCSACEEKQAGKKET